MSLILHVKSKSEALAMTPLKTLALASAAMLVAGAAHAAPTTWAYSAKTGVGASYEAYVDGAYKAGDKTGAVSKVWFSIARARMRVSQWALPVVSVKAEGTKIRSTSPIAR